MSLPPFPSGDDDCAEDLRCPLCDDTGIGQRQGTHCPICFGAAPRRMTEDDL